MSYDPHRALVLAKLSRLLGNEDAQRVLSETLVGLGMGRITSAHDRLRIGQALTARGGPLSTIGQAVCAQASLHMRHDATKIARLNSELAHAAAIVDGSDDAIIAEDMVGAIQTWNAGAQRLYGYAASEVVGQRADLIVPADHQEERAKLLDRVRKGLRVDNLETVHVTKAGTPVHVSLTISPVKDPSGHVIGASSIGRDITERLRAEEEIRRLNAELEERVRARTAELAAANEELEAFAYSVSHDLRAPLRSITGFGAILEEEFSSVLDDEGRRLLKRMMAGADKMGRLIDDILEFSRLGRAHLTKRPVDMGKLADEVITEVLAAHQGRDPEISVGDLPRACGDRRMLKHVMANLIDNAVKYTRPRPHARISVEGATEGPETRYVVSDNGVGFDMLYVERLFHVFQRLHHEDEFEGTGVGLALVQRIVQRHGGRVGAEGRMGQGATIWFTLPVAGMEADHE